VAPAPRPTQQGAPDRAFGVSEPAGYDARTLFEALFVSIAVVTLGEMGDKTQLLAMMLAARFRRPAPILLGIFVATLLNHAAAGAVGNVIATLLGDTALRWLVGASFLGMAVWMMIPDRLDEGEPQPPRHGVFLTTAIAFFLAEMGDKTQIATIALAARYVEVVAVVIGTTIGMMLSNLPAVFIGHQLATRIPMKLVHGIAAAIFTALGVATLFGLGPSLR
jgi:putative Ca2+/H+ antiporter (TMEM165/GDT1 family)